MCLTSRGLRQWFSAGSVFLFQACGLLCVCAMSWCHPLWFGSWWPHAWLGSAWSLDSLLLLEDRTTLVCQLHFVRGLKGAAFAVGWCKEGAVSNCKEKANSILWQMVNGSIVVQLRTKGNAWDIERSDCVIHPLCVTDPIFLVRKLRWSTSHHSSSFTMNSLLRYAFSFSRIRMHG